MALKREVILRFNIDYNGDRAYQEMHHLERLVKLGEITKEEAHERAKRWCKNNVEVTTTRPN